MKHETLCNDCEGEGLKGIDVLNKIWSDACGSEDFITIDFMSGSSCSFF